MSTPSPSTPQIIKLIARFVHKGTSQPVSDPALRVRFFDQDAFKDDFLGEATLSSDGVAEIIFDSSAFQSGVLGRIFERLKEKRPDVYCQIVDKDRVPIFRTAVQWDVDVTQFNEVTKRSRPTVDLGTFEFKAGEGVLDPFYYSGIHRPMM